MDKEDVIDAMILYTFYKTKISPSRELMEGLYDIVIDKKNEREKEYVTKDAFADFIDLIFKELDKKKDKDVPSYPNVPTDWTPANTHKCWVCNMSMNKSMGYVCPHQNCPSKVTCGGGLGGSEYQENQSVVGGGAVQNTGAVSGDISGTIVGYHWRD